ncbi:MAG: PPOX class F420-dependent oxidoreductase [Solirubrobacterales bacterium]|nr:PPOX class F420-dependent oxidoreductase [Solirubrobacterales bacterium]MBV9165194.1 PPOX class F420-dependent oxidoreductase [Solirubrobacterales bacterium]MBV9536207.1 PPOX class F420-dependent oxidoreductase [Solirubrobacterales bacterium]
MTSLKDPSVRELLEQPNYAMVCTHNRDGSIHSTIVWIAAEDGDAVSLNSAVGRVWPTNLQRDPRVTVIVFEADNPYTFLEIRGTSQATTEGADEHIDLLAKKYTGQDKFPDRRPGDQRIKFVVTPEHVRLVKA